MVVVCDDRGFRKVCIWITSGKGRQGISAKKKKRPKSFNAALSSDTTEHGDLKLALW